jgi:hypothetical protein
MTLSKERALLCASLTTGALLSQSVFNYFKNKSDQESESSSRLGVVDPAHDELRSLNRTEAFTRSRVLSNVSYKLALALLKGGESYHG